MKFALSLAVLVAGATCLTCAVSAQAVSGGPHDTLAPPEGFASISDTATRSAALFAELGKVLTNPRCVNCHPAGDRPRQGDMRRLHQPPGERGADGFGLPAMRRPICHQAANFEPARAPGNPIWHLAPREMGWDGNRPLASLVEHIGEDHLVGWAWAPGSGRRPAPGTQKEAGALVEAWVKSSAACPTR